MPEPTRALALAPDEDAASRAESRQLLRDLIERLIVADGMAEKMLPLVERLVACEEARLKAETELREERKADRKRTDEAEKRKVELDKQRSQNWLVIFERSTSAFQHPLVIGAIGSALPWVGLLLARWLGLPVPVPGGAP